MSSDEYPSEDAEQHDETTNDDGLGAAGPGPDAGKLDAGRPDVATGRRDAGEGGEHDDVAPPDTSADASSASTTGMSAGCSSSEHPKTGRFTLMVAGQKREYLLHVPAEAAAQPLPLVLALHGYTMSAVEHEQITGMSALADQEGFAVVYPQGLGDIPGWNAGTCCAYEQPPRDDMAFIGALIDHVGEQLCLDLKRVYSTGFSNGGMMTYRLACQMSERIAAAASVSGSIVVPLTSCKPSHPMPFMHIHGADDAIVPYEGGPGPDWLTPLGETPPDFPSVREEVQAFASFNRCSESPRMTFQNDEASCEAYGGCTSDAQVAMCTIIWGGHAWPGGGDMGLASIVLGYQTPLFPATQKIWEFLKTHHLP